MSEPNEIPLPAPARKTAAPPASAAPESPAPLTVGSFFAEGRALADARRAHLARVGMLPQHVEALRMPELGEKPVTAVGADEVPEQAPPRYEPKRLPKLPGVNVSLAEE